MQREEIFKYTKKEEIVNVITHGLGVVLAYIGMIYLVYIASINGTTKDVIAFAFYGTTLILLFLMSTLYHAMTNFKVKKVFKKLDHSMIFLLIFGTYVPYTVVVLNTPKSYFILFIIFLMSIIGIYIKLFKINSRKGLQTILYVVIGWMVLFEIKDLIAGLSFEALLFLLLGAIFYTFGAVIYAKSKFDYHHGLWHIFVLIAAIFQYISIACFIF